MKTLNEVYSSLSTRRRYEVWFMRLGLADGSGACWLRYLLVNPGRSGCDTNSQAMPVQVWATWFPRDERPQTLIQGFPLSGLDLSERGSSPFHFRVANNEIEENSCRGELDVNGHQLEWDLSYRSTFRTTLSSKGWIGFSRTPHSNAVFSGRITFDGRVFQGTPLGFGLQGHNCGYRHRTFWTWAHLYFIRPDGSATTFEALTYDMPLGMVFRRAVLWHESRKHVFRNLHESRRDEANMLWQLDCRDRNAFRVDVTIDGSGLNKHSLPYLKTDCSGTFPVFNNSLAKAQIRLQHPAGLIESFQTSTGAVLEMVGQD